MTIRHNVVLVETARGGALDIESRKLERGKLRYGLSHAATVQVDLLGIGDHLHGPHDRGLVESHETAEKCFLVRGPNDLHHFVVGRLCIHGVRVNECARMGKLRPLALEDCLELAIGCAAELARKARDRGFARVRTFG